VPIYSEKLPPDKARYYNQDGFRDQDEFHHKNIDQTAFRVLLLGDSFTYGAAAVYNHRDGFADVLQKELEKTRPTLVWNTGIPGIGQKQELHLLKRYFPMLTPQIVILGFCMNDFYDNLYPMECITCMKRNLDQSIRAHL